mgnify:FL=1
MKKCVYQVKRPISKVNRPVCEAKYDANLTFEPLPALNPVVIAELLERVF